MVETLVEARGVAKAYGDCVAVQSATVAFAPGRIHAVVGENGAGKSTLLGMVAGLVLPDRGSVTVTGSALAPHTAAEAIRRGIGMVAQHFQLIEALTALENVVLGAERTRFGILDDAAARARLREVAGSVDLDVAPDALVADLDVGARQRLEIARVLFRDARVVILDEPTAVLTPQEASVLYRRLRALAEGGRAIVVVTHKLDEVLDHADVATVMRRGEVVAEHTIARDLAPSERAELRAALTRDVMGATNAAAPGARPEPGSTAVLALEDVRAPRLGPLSFSVRAGEIVGIAGIEGNGQRELFAVLAGLTSATGKIEAQGGISVLHGDRHEEGLVLDASLEDNVLLGELPRFARGPLLDVRAVAAAADARLAASGATPRTRTATARSLSGGNQQKIVVERALARTVAAGGDAAVLCVAHPTRGVDVGAQAAIHARLIAAARAGCGVVVASSDLDELRELSHRILVLVDGKIAAEVSATADNETLGARMLGREATGAAP